MTLIGTTKLKNRLARIKNMKLDATIAKASTYVKDEARKLAPVDKGELRQSITTKTITQGNKVIGEIYTNLEYARFVEFGTGPVGQANHSGISDKVNPRYSPDGWRYFDEDLGKWIYTKGQKAQPYLYPALHNNREKVKEYIRKDLKSK